MPRFRSIGFPFRACALLGALSILGLLGGLMPVWAQGLYTPPTRSQGEQLTSQRYNADHAVHWQNHIPAMIDDYSASAAQMRSQTSPGSVGSESLPTSLAGELERLRFGLAQLKGSPYWYEPRNALPGYSPPFVESGCVPSIPVSSLTLGAFACTAIIQSTTSNLLVRSVQAAAVVGPFSGGDGTYWLAMSEDTSSSIAGWTRQPSTYYVWQKSATQPTPPAGGLLVTKITVASSVISAIRALGPPLGHGIRLINAVAECGISPVSDVFTAATWASQTTALQACINGAKELAANQEAATRSVVYLPTGQYYLAGRITIPAGICLIGDGKNKTQIFSNTTFADTNGLLDLTGVGGQPSCVEHLGVTVFGGAFTAGVKGINARQNGAFVRDVWVSGFDICVLLAGTDTVLTDFVTELCRNGIGITQGNITVSNGISYGHTQQGIAIDNSAISVSDRGMVHIDNVRDISSGVVGFLAVAGGNAQLSNISCFSSDGGKYSTACLQVSGAFDNLAVNNLSAILTTATSGSADGVLLGASAARVRLSNCTVQGWRFGFNSGGAGTVTVQGCHATLNLSRGFSVTGGTRIVLQGNTAWQNGGAGAQEEGFHIENSTASAHISVIGNNAVTEAAGTQDYGFLVLNSGANAVTVFSGNDAANNNVADYTETGTIAQDQGIGYFGVNAVLWRVVQGEGPLDFPNIVAQTCELLTMGVDGAVLANNEPATVAPGASAIATGVTYSAYVSADNTVTVQACNGTAVDRNPTADVFRVMVQKRAR